MSVKLLTEPHLELLSLKGSCRGSSASTLVKMPHGWKSYVTAQIFSNFSLKQIEDTETEFSRCIQFLSSFLQSVIQRGSFPHCKLFLKICLLCHLLQCVRSCFSKQCRPRPDCFFRSLVWVNTVCLYTYVSQ